MMNFSGRERVIEKIRTEQEKKRQLIHRGEEKKKKRKTSGGRFETFPSVFIIPVPVCLRNIEKVSEI